MHDDYALTAGVSPDGLRSRRDIKILICFILANFKEPLSRDDLLEIITHDGLANYFEVCAAIDPLIENGNISEDEETKLLTATDNGRLIAESLYTSLPLTVREKSMAVGSRMLSRRRHEKENNVEIIPSGNGYIVKCEVLDGDTVLLATSLYVTNIEYARIVKERFLNAPQELYLAVLKQLTDLDS